jgi:hypothetical protein
MSSQVLPVPDYISPIHGYRSWIFDGEGLKSFNESQWTPGSAFEAVCAQTRLHGFKHQAPKADCTCGVYAARNEEELFRIGFDFCILGQVWLWGRVIEHEGGWRAQYAYPKSFIVTPDVIPWRAQDAQTFFQRLTMFNADIFLQVERKSRIGGQTIPLWTRGGRWNQNGVAHLKSIFRVKHWELDS